MNNGRIWCVVNPSIGLPLFLGGVTVIALSVHTAVLSNTSWMSGYWQGTPRAARADAAPAAPSNLAAAPAAAQAQAPYSISVTPVSGVPGEGVAFVVTVTPRGSDQPPTMTLVQQGGLPPDPASAIR
jgi:light-harvesting protein B-800-850 alpha chain